MRIVGGAHKGRIIVAPEGDAIRPTGDRVRESLFNILAHHDFSDELGADFDLEDARVLDLFAGTGALGLEAISRGASFALFVDDSIEARGAIRENMENLGLTGHAKLYKRDATKLGPRPGSVGPINMMRCSAMSGACCITAKRLIPAWPMHWRNFAPRAARFCCSPMRRDLRRSYRQCWRIWASRMRPITAF